MKPPILILTGPTGVGKTETSLQLAKQCCGEIISADSMQVYRQMDIGTAKIRPDQTQGIPHYMIDEFDPDEEFNVYLFQKKVKEYLSEIYSRGKLPILVGGTGFYIQAVLYDIAFTDHLTDFSYRRELEDIAAKDGPDELFARLKEVDPVSADCIHKNNIKRVIRALEYYHETGETMSSHNEEQRKKESPYSFLYAVLTMNRSVLYERINKRVDSMVSLGLINEVQTLMNRGYHRDLVSMQGLGYKEIAAALDGEITMEEAIYQLKRDTRHFAKRQMTWFKREKEVSFFDKDHYSSTEELVNAIIEEAGKRGVLP